MLLKSAKNIALLLISSIIALLFSELLVRIFLPQDKMVTWIEMNPEGFVMNQSGGTAFQEYQDIKAEYTFTEQRLRGSDPVDSKTKVLTLGDSFTFGLLLNEEDTYVHLLQDKADSLAPDSIQFLNGAVGGAGLADWPGWLNHYGQELKPDYVLYFLNNHDIARSLSKNLYIYSENETDSIIQSQRWEPNEFMFSLGRKNWYRWLQAHSELMNGIVKVLWRSLYYTDVTSNFNSETTTVPIPPLESFNPDSNYSNKLGNQLITHLNNWCLKNECRLLIGSTGFFEEDSISAFDQNFYDWMESSDWKSKGIYNDITQCVMDESGSDLESVTIRGDTHPNKEGANIISNCTWNWLEPILKSH